MYFNMIFKDESAEKATHAYMYAICIYADFILLFFVNLVLLILGFVITDIIRNLMYFEINFLVFIAVCATLIIAEILFVLVLEKKRRMEYVRIDQRGVYIYTGTGETFGYFSANPMGVLITFDKIKGFYSGVPYGMQKNFAYIYKNSFDFLNKIIRANRGITHSQKLIPAIPNGKYDEDCILIELSNGTTAVLPVDNIDKFSKYLTEYLEQYKQLNKID